MIRYDRICAMLVVLFLALSQYVGLRAQASTVYRLQTTTASSADFDGDLVVGFGDFLLFAQAFGTADDRFDLNGNDVVDFPDFIQFATQFGQTVDPPDPSPSLPTPVASVVLADTTDYEVIVPAFSNDQGLASLQSTQLGRSIEVRLTGMDANPVVDLTVQGTVLRGTLLVIVTDTSGVYVPAVAQGVPDSSAIELQDGAEEVPARFVLSESGTIEIDLTLYTILESVEAELRIGDDVTELVGFSIEDLEDVSWAVDTYRNPVSELARVMSATVEGASAVISVGLRDTLGSTLGGLMAADRKLFEWMLTESDSIDTNTVNALLARGYGEQVTITLEDSTEAYLQVHRWSPSLAPHIWALELILPAEFGSQPTPPPLPLPDPVATVALADTMDYLGVEAAITDATGLAILTSTELGRDIEVLVKGTDGDPIPDLTVRATVLNGTFVVVVNDTTGNYPAAIVEGLPDSTSLIADAASKPATFIVTDRSAIFAGGEYIAIELTLLTLAESADSGLVVTSGLVEMTDFLVGDFKDASWSLDTYEAPLFQLARVINSVTAGASAAISIGFVDTVGSTTPSLIASNRRLFDWAGSATSDSTPMDTSSTSDADTVRTISSEALKTLLTRVYGKQLTSTLEDSTEAYLLVHQWSPAMAPYVFGLELVLPASAGEQPRPELQLSTQRVAVVGTTTTEIDLRDLGTDLLT